MTDFQAYSVPRLATKWDCSKEMIYKLVRSNRLRAFQVGGLIRITAAEVERFECQSTASSDSEGDMRSSGDHQTESGIGDSLAQQTGTGRKRRRVVFGNQAEVIPGPWGA
jgi:excisionase family DNA binding protein